ncbi:deoxyribose-phosphate aldolase [Pyrobaculum neutrophilum]|uniref:Deoxyribose-phosphate aldolase n=1 Tax=Pyrobaculum neutrophilum (strain DSM 2338 / JCM 9278 / NBRC 100436 / V24Sta) TaxID=444157 RepID=DEOC_PYRNV|nr:deoxyribose-phosphate aldolase [Pyrobaculum neutrophilum]B1YB76.1 RecName: Full=Deoxyribose-phosphate aldolase; Short=DERA; AltName: Full=2-deoxy-D-ribose 5-phosphate aldolase; AltName: Full=Phosphodeoxyriboaldolase; Short=Deoxyriboaldolase [Pyrobaculum neutrophilum V24Sta]ACB39207.1 deoxyribose-phosphate aldolase [Pyrobaculum neutrophilum V24Sta]
MLHLVDYALLKPYLTLEEVARGARRAEELGVAAYCVNPLYAPYVRELLSRVKLCVVADFPFGAMPTAARAALVARIAEYAEEIDVVAPIGLVKSHMWGEVRRDLLSVVGAAGGRVVKVIVEEPYLTDEERHRLYDIVAESGAHFIKSSTGFAEEAYARQLGNPTYSTPERAAAIARYIRERGFRLGVKMAGGIRTAEQAKAIIDAIGFGTDPTKVRLGTSTPEALRTLG